MPCEPILLRWQPNPLSPEAEGFTITLRHATSGTEQVIDVGLPAWSAETPRGDYRDGTYYQSLCMERQRGGSPSRPPLATPLASAPSPTRS